MSEKQPHIIIIDGAPGSGRKMLCFELTLTLLYNNQKTALLLSADSPLHRILDERRQAYPQLPLPQVITRSQFVGQNNNFDAVIIPEITAEDELAVNADTYITLIPKDRKNINRFQKDTAYINSMWELKKKIAAARKRSLNWVVCENFTAQKNNGTSITPLTDKAKTCGFRLAPPLADRKPYRLYTEGVSAQDKTFPELKNQMRYDDICAKREIIKLAEFIFNA